MNRLAKFLGVLAFFFLVSVDHCYSAEGSMAMENKDNASMSMDARDDESWTFFQAGFWFDVPSATTNSNVNGIKSGWPICAGHGKVYGLEISWFASATDNIRGVQTSWVINLSKKMTGLQASWITNVSEEMTGVQGCFIANVNKEMFTGMQASCVNVAGDYIGFQPAAILNVTENFKGFQLSPLYNEAKHLNGVQMSMLNFAESSEGIQFGIMNSSKKEGMQFGLINYIEDAWIPYMIGFNVKF